MEEWFRVAFSQSQVREFSAALQNIHDAQRHANWPADMIVLVSDDCVLLPAIGLSQVIYFPPKAVERFSALIGEFGSEPCLEPLSFGLEAHGNSPAYTPGQWYLSPEPVEI
jgi:hypothetical protein